MIERDCNCGAQHAPQHHPHSDACNVYSRGRRLDRFWDTIDDTWESARTAIEALLDILTDEQLEKMVTARMKARSGD